MQREGEDPKQNKAQLYHSERLQSCIKVRIKVLRNYETNRLTPLTKQPFAVQFSNQDPVLSPT
jgi:hypothetical protein